MQSNPAPGVVAPRTPSTITLSFTEGVEPSGSAVRVERLDGGEVSTGEPSTGAGEATLTVPVDGDLAGEIYQVEWSALGVDGHQVGGEFRFGVLGADGAPPKDIRQLGAAGHDLAAPSWRSVEEIAPVLFRWVGLLAAALMLGGWLLARRARAAGAQVPEPRAVRVASGAWVVALVVAVQNAAAVALGGAQPGVDAELLTGTEAGALALIRLVVLVLLGWDAWCFRRPGALGLAGALALGTHALDGHTAAVSDGRPLAWAEAVAHAEAAGVWAGGLLALVLWSWLGKVPVRPLVRAFAPLAGTATAVLALTGVLIAAREVDSWMFLRWSNYGRVVMAKSAMLLGVLALAGAITWRRRRGTPLPRLLRIEAIGAVCLLALAAILAGLVPGRAQPAFARRGNLLTGPTLTTVATADGPLQLTVAPSRRGTNTISAIPLALRETELPPQPSSIEVRLTCACASGDQRVQLHQAVPGVWSAAVDLAKEGTWFADLSVSAKPAVAPVAVPVQDPRAGGPEPFLVRTTADLSGEEAPRCRAFVQGLALGVGRLNSGGGVDGGRKVALDVHDDGADPERAAHLARLGGPDVLAPCGAGGAGALRAAGDALTLVGDPSTPSAADAGARADGEHRTFRLALDPYAEGVGVGRLLETELTKTPGPPHRVAVVLRDADSGQRSAGLQAALTAHGVTVDRLPANAAESAASLKRITDPHRYLATVLDGDAARVSAALRELGDRDDPPLTSILLPASRIGGESFMLSAGRLGRLGALRLLSEVVPDSADGLVYVGAMKAIFPVDEARIAGLRGYVTALALTEAVRDGTGISDMVGRLRQPSHFTDALTIPWREDAPTRGSQGFVMYTPNFLPPNLRPGSSGPVAHSGSFFQAGTWARMSPFVYGPQVDVPGPGGQAR